MSVELSKDFCLFYAKTTKNQKEYTKIELEKEKMVVKHKFNFIGGEFVVFQDKTIEDIQVKTLLGSCVSVIAYDVKTGITGVNHFLLPIIMTQTKNDYREGLFSIQSMIAKMMEYGCKKNHIKLKIYGGAKMSSTSTIGQKNIEFVTEWAKQNNISFQLVDIGGVQGRQIEVKNYFIVKSSKV